MRTGSLLKRIAAALLAMAFLLALAGTAFAEGELVYEGESEARGVTVEGRKTVVVRITDGEKKYPAYCLDSDVYIREDEPYTRVNLDEADLGRKAKPGLIRAIVMNALPTVTLDTVKTLANLPTLTAEEAVAAAQLAIWSAVKEKNLPKLEGNLKALFDYYMALPEAAAAETPAGSVELEAMYEEDGEKINATFRYRFIGTNADGSPLAGSYAFDKDPVSEYSANISTSEEGEYSFVTVWGLPKDAAFNFSVRANQTLKLDAYFYSPVNGRCATQSLVGPFEGRAEISAAVPYRYVPTQDLSLRILKVDSLNTELGLEGAVFEVSRSENFDVEPIYKITTGPDGRASVAGLEEGDWYVREITPPPGYMPYEGTFKVLVNQYTREQVLKNTAFGSVSIYKHDENGVPVEGAVFALYAGEAADEAKLINGHLITDDAGLIFSGDLAPGKYTVRELSVPTGYHLNDTPVTVTVEPGKQVVAEIENLTVKRGKLNFYKRDAETMEPLGGAVLAIYGDAACQDELHRVTTLKTEAVSVEDLLPGTYYCRELAVPSDDYQLDDTIKTVVLEEGESKDVIFYNIYIPKTAGNYGFVALIGGLSLLAGVAMLIVFRKRLFGPNAR